MLQLPPNLSYKRKGFNLLLIDGIGSNYLIRGNFFFFFEPQNTSCTDKLMNFVLRLKMVVVLVLSPDDYIFMLGPIGKRFKIPFSLSAETVFPKEKREKKRKKEKKHIIMDAKLWHLQTSMPIYISFPVLSTLHSL